MTNKIFKYLVIAVLIFMTGCSDNMETLDLNNIISFDISRDKTRSVINDVNSFSSGDALSVYGISYKAFSNAAKIFDNTPLVYVLPEKTWKYNFEAYWLEGFNYQFRAFYPYADQTSQERLYSLQHKFNETGESNYVISDFMVYKDHEKQIDLMVSDIVKRGPISADPMDKAPVSLSFHHILSNVKFTLKMKSDADLVKVNLKSVQLLGLKSQGDCSDGVWDTSAYSDDMDGYSIKYPVGSEPALSVANYSPWPQGLLLIPQEVTSNVKLIVDYDLIIKKNQTDSNPTIVPKKDVINLSEYNKRSWDKGTRLNYVMVFDSNMDIEFFIVNVEPWAFAKNSTPVIIQ